LAAVLIPIALKSWTLEDPLPTPETIGDLPTGLFAALAEPASRALLPTDFTVEAVKDPKADTSASSESEGFSPVASSSSPQVQTTSSSSESGATGASSADSLTSSTSTSQPVSSTGS
jgi:hypothetical protein